MRATPPLSPPFTPLAGGKCRRVAFMAHYAACGVILSLRQKHPQAASCAVRATPKKSSALSLYLSFSFSLSPSNTPKFSRMSAPMPRGIPHLSPPPLHTLCGGFNVFFNAPSNPRALSYTLLFYYFYYFYYFLLVHKQHCCAPFGA